MLNAQLIANKLFKLQTASSPFRRFFKRVASIQVIIVVVLACVTWLIDYPFGTAIGLTGFMLIDLGVVGLAIYLVLDSDRPNEWLFDRLLRLSTPLIVFLVGLISLTVGMLTQ